MKTNVTCTYEFFVTDKCGEVEKKGYIFKHSIVSGYTEKEVVMLIIMLNELLV